jgi:transposase
VSLCSVSICIPDDQGQVSFKAAVDDPRRFRSSRTVAAHFGLTPRRYQSGEMDNPGRISKAGDPDVRCALYTAAHALISRSASWCTLKAWGMRRGLRCSKNGKSTSRQLTLQIA